MMHLRYVVAVAVMMTVTALGPIASAAEPTPTELIAKAAELLSQRKQAEANTLLSKAIDQLATKISDGASSGGPQAMMARAFWLKGQRGKTMEHIDKAIELKPDHAPFRVERARYNMMLKQYPKVMADLEKATQLDGSNFQYWLDLGSVYTRLYKFREAQRAYSSALQADPGNADVLYSIGIMWMRKGEHAKAIEVLDQLVKAKPDYRRGRFALAKLQQQQGHHADAIKHFEYLNDNTPEQASILANMIQCYYALKKPAEREATRRELFKLYNLKKVNAEKYCCDYFTHGKFKITALEYFELKGERPKRYEFLITSLDGNKRMGSVVLASSELTTELARKNNQVGSEQRLYHLDYDNLRSHYSFELIKFEPSYTAVRLKVVDILDGKLKPESRLDFGPSTK